VIRDRVKRVKVMGLFPSCGMIWLGCYLQNSSPQMMNTAKIMNMIRALVASDIGLSP
jgi:hypothetical protein